MLGTLTTTMKRKVDIYGGKNPRDLPLYTITEAARVVRLNPATLRSWALGRSYATRSGAKSWRPLIQVADSRLGRLSFANLVFGTGLSVTGKDRYAGAGAGIW